MTVSAGSSTRGNSVPLGGIFLVLAIIIFLIAKILPSVSFASSSNVEVTTAGDGIDWDEVQALEIGRHSSPDHNLGTPEVRTQILEAISVWQVYAANPDPNGNGPKLICKAVQFANAMYIAFWVASTENPLVGTVSVFNKTAGNWVTSYTGNSRELFLNGKPSRSINSWIVDCNDPNLKPPLMAGN